VVVCAKLSPCDELNSAHPKPAIAIKLISTALDPAKFSKYAPGSTAAAKVQKTTYSAQAALPSCCARLWSEERCNPMRRRRNVQSNRGVVKLAIEGVEDRQ